MIHLEEVNIAALTAALRVLYGEAAIEAVKTLYGAFDAAMAEGYEAATNDFDEGFDSGYDEGHLAGYKYGREVGYYEAREAFYSPRQPEPLDMAAMPSELEEYFGGSAGSAR